MRLVVLASPSNWFAVQVTNRLLNTSVLLKWLCFTVFLVYVLLNVFLLLTLNWLIMNRFECLLCIRVTIKGEDLFFYFLLLRIDLRPSSLTALCITFCSNMSICLLYLISSYLSFSLFSHFRFVFRHFYSLFIIIVCALIVFWLCLVVLASVGNWLAV